MSEFVVTLRELANLDDAVALVRLGQASVALAGGGRIVLIDPFLSPHPERLVPPPVAPETLADVDLVLVTHEHWDHLDGPTCEAIARVAPQATFVCPEPIVDQLVAAGVPAERVSGTRPGRSYQQADATIWPIAAKHGLHVTDAYTFGEVDGVPRFLGYVVELAGVRAYHAGDTIPYEGLAEAVRALQPDVALLPINGRDWYRERLDIVGNLEAREAAQLAAAIGAELLVPLHYDMFAANLADPGDLVRLVHQWRLAVSVLVLPVGLPAVVRPARRRGR
ncbi:MBL fold metallo-hydrolase [Thermomicrobium sp. 4228-Ro]|uniref:MBL fold metallo-hydrolase n=1 Tax=Thermomicrobium sp. 4228-Ro TaxID=2993937 RepID=UPI0022498FC9|nr:MBL fold metallo-hydrolase [Thermomicrobium sp. 4228-Ro]MCX2728410.1 MBL fold metallo-hydrolase [Thermomicrobium sp. 4228-Ro]